MRLAARLRATAHLHLLASSRLRGQGEPLKLIRPPDPNRGLRPGTSRPSARRSAASPAARGDARLATGNPRRAGLQLKDRSSRRRKSPVL